MEVIEEIAANTSERIRPAQFYLLGGLCEQLIDVENVHSIYYKGKLPHLPESWTFVLSESRLNALKEKK